MATYTFAFKRDLIAKLHEHFAEYQRDPESAWKRIALELSSTANSDHSAAPHRWQDLSAYFKRSLVYKLDKFSQDQEFVDRLQYPCLRRVYSVVVELVDKKVDGVVNRRKEVVEENKLFLKSLIDDSYDPAVVAAYKRRGNKKTRITVNINVGDQVYNLTPSQRELLMKMEQQRLRKNRREKVRRQVEPGTWHDAATGSPVVLDGVPVTIENAPSPAQNERSARRLLDEESLDINTQEYNQIIKDSLEPEMPPLPVRTRLLSIASTVESEDEVQELSSDDDASDNANGISISEEGFVVINPDEILSESTINTTSTLLLDPLQLSVQQSQAPPTAQQIAENAEKDSTTSEPLFTPSSGESAKTTTTEQLAPVPSMIYRTEDLIAKSQPPTLILEESAATEKRPATAVVNVERLERVEAVIEVDDPVEIVISDERIAEGSPNPENPVVTTSELQPATSLTGVNGAPVEPSVNEVTREGPPNPEDLVATTSTLQPATPSNCPVEPAVNDDVTRPGPADMTSSTVQNNDHLSIADQTANRSIGNRTVATQTPPAKVIPIVVSASAATTAAAPKVSVARRSLSMDNGTESCVPRTSDGLMPKSFFYEEGDSQEEEEEEDREEPAADPTGEVQPVAAEKEVSTISSNPPSNTAVVEVEVRVEVPEEPLLGGVEDTVEAEPEVVPINVEHISPAKAGDEDLNNNSQPNTTTAKEPPSSSSAPAAAVTPASHLTLPGNSDITRSCTPVPDLQKSVVDQGEELQQSSHENFQSASYFYDSADEEESESDDDSDGTSDGVQPTEKVAVAVDVAAEPSPIVEQCTEKGILKAAAAVTETDIIPKEVLANPEENTACSKTPQDPDALVSGNPQPKSSNAKEPPPPSSPSPSAADAPPPPPAAASPGNIHRSYTPVPDSQADYESLWSNENLLPASYFYDSLDEESESGDDNDGTNDGVQPTEKVVVAVDVAAEPPPIVEKTADKSTEKDISEPADTSETDRRPKGGVLAIPEENGDNSQCISYSSSKTSLNSDGLPPGQFRWEDADDEDNVEDEEDEESRTEDDDDEEEGDPKEPLHDRRAAEPAAPSTIPTPPPSSGVSTSPLVVAKNRWHAHHAAIEPVVRRHHALYDSLRQSWPQLFQPSSPIAFGVAELNDLNTVIIATLFSTINPSDPARIVQLRNMVDAMAIRIAFGTTLQELEEPKEPARPPPPAALAEEPQRSSWEIVVTSESALEEGVPASPASKRIRIGSSSSGGQLNGSGGVATITITLSDSEDSPSVVLPIRKKRKYRVRQT